MARKQSHFFARQARIEAARKLRDRGLTIDAIAKRLGTTNSTIRKDLAVTPDSHHARKMVLIGRVHELRSAGKSLAAIAKLLGIPLATAGKYARIQPPQPPAATPPKKLRERLKPSRYRFVRSVKGRSAWQARVPLPGGTKGESLNLGLFTEGEWDTESEWAAGRASREFVHRYKPGPDGKMPSVWSVIEGMKRDGICPEGLQPRWVFQHADGTFGARVRKGGVTIATTRSYADPIKAQQALRDRVDVVELPRDVIQVPGGFAAVRPAKSGRLGDRIHAPGPFPTPQEAADALAAAVAEWERVKAEKAAEEAADG